MSEKNATKKWMYIRWAALRLALVVFDILAVNASYFLALVARFYVANEFHALAGRYLEAFRVFAPYYTVFCLVVFAALKLYNSMWKYAGMNDMNRILAANLLCVVFQVAGTCLFVCRMPITYYCIGAAVQLCLITLSRFSYRILSFEFNKLSKVKNDTSLNAMVVGFGETARIVLNQLEKGNVAHPVCVLNYKGYSAGNLLDGVQVVKGLENLESALKKHKVSIAILADPIMPQEIRKQIRETCKAANVDVQDFSVYLPSSGSITLKSIAEYSKGEIELIIDGKHHIFTNGEQALAETTGSYVVDSIYAKDNRLVVEIHGNRVVLNDLNAAWVKEQEKNTGEEVSFF